MSLHKELKELVTKIAPTKDIAGGFMTRNDIIQLIEKVADEASLLGWIHAETMSRKRLENKILRLEQEVEILKGQLKDAELELIAKIAPSKDIAGGFMSRDQIIQLIRKVATDASLIGYCHAEKLTRERMDKKLTVIEQELTIIKEQLKDTEIELIVATK